MSPLRVGGILLAAGVARRFGSDKRFAVLPDGECLLLRAAGVLAQAVDDCLLVVGASDDPEAFARLLPGWRVIRADASASGMGASLAAGVRAAPAEWEGVLVALADMPAVSPETARAVRATLAEAVVVPRHAGRSGHPVGFPRRLFGALGALSGDAGARSIVIAEGERVRFLDRHDPGMLLDVDTPEALCALGAQPD